MSETNMDQSRLSHEKPLGHMVDWYGGQALLDQLQARGVSSEHVPAVIEMLWAIQQMAWGDWREAIKCVNSAIYSIEAAHGETDAGHRLLQPFGGAVDESVIALVLRGPIQFEQCPFKLFQRYLIILTGGQVRDYGVDHRVGVRHIPRLVAIRQWVDHQLLQFRQVVIKSVKRERA